MSHSLVLIGIDQGFKRCDSCGDTIRKHESRWVLAEPRPKDIHTIRGFAYCESCEEMALENAKSFKEWDGETYNSLTQMEDEVENDGESHLRLMEEYGAYQAQGCTQEFFPDLEEGFIRH